LVFQRPRTEQQLRALLREAESELDAATKRSELNLAASRFMQLKQALKRLQQEPEQA
jgi:hypothetical protein